MNKLIRIECDPKLLLPIDCLHGIQGNLKSMDKDDFLKLERSFFKDGVDFPFTVWNEFRGQPCKPKWWLVDGHGRVLVLNETLKRGGCRLEGGLVPCTETFAKNIKAAREKVLRSSSTYHKIQREGLHQFMVENGFTMQELRAVGSFDTIQFNDFENEFFTDDPMAQMVQGAGEHFGDDFKAKKLLSYLDKETCRILLTFEKKQYDQVCAFLEALQERHGVQDFAAALVKESKGYGTKTKNASKKT